jgi:quinol monooxygenase YgiN
VSLIVAGTYRLPAENVPALQPHAAAMVAASRAEGGCIEYAHAADVSEPGLMRFFEIWRDQAALDAHAKAPHMAVWRAAGDGLGVHDRRIFAYDIAAERRI